jgi:hypothetical protein
MKVKKKISKIATFCFNFCKISFLIGFGLTSEEQSSYFPPSIPPTQLLPGQWYTVRIQSMSFWRSRLTVRQPSYYQMNMTMVSAEGISRAHNLAVYGREGLAPTVTNYDWVHLVGENGEAKTMLEKSPGSFSHTLSLSITNLVLVEKASRIHLILNFGHMKNNVKIIH